MDVFVKRFFWVIDLLAVGICAALGGRATSHVIEQNWLLAEEPAAAAARHLAPPQERARGKEVDKIVERNVFCSTCRPPPPPAADEGGDGGAPDSNEPQKSS